MTELRPVDEALADLSPTYLLCRDVHHSWTIVGWTAATGGGVDRTLACSRCGTERVDRWSLSGMRIGSSYRYAEGYQLRGVEDAGDHTAWRREVLRRAGYGNEIRRGGRSRRS